MRSIFRKFLWSACLCGCAITAHAQEFQDYLSKYTQKNSTGYMQPLADAFGAIVNTGWFHSANIEKMGPQIYIGAVGIMALVPSSKKTFTATPEGLFTPKLPMEVPTVFGSGESVTAEGNGGTSYTFPGGLNVEAITIPAFQLDVGSYRGTQASVRFLIYDFGGEVGKLNMIGVGVRHNISQYFSSFPAELAIGYYWATSQLGDITDAKNNFISLQGSYLLNKLTFYGGLGYEITTMQVGYTFKGEEGTEQDINFDLRANNKLRLTLGTSLKLGSLRLSADYNFSDQGIFSCSVGFDIGRNIADL